MSEIEQLTQQKTELQKEQSQLKNWIELKRNLSQKFKNPSEAFKSLKKEGNDTLSVEDFGDYAKGIDLTEVLNGVTLNEEGFTKAWEQWEYNYKQNEHKLQIINEKLQLQTILDNQSDNQKDGLREFDLAKKPQSSVDGCQNLEDLQKKLDTLSSQQKQEKKDVIENEQECFQQLLTKKSDVHNTELTFSKIQLKQNEDQQEEGQVTNSSTKPKISYIDGTLAITKFKGNPVIGKSTLGNSQISVKQSFIVESSIQISPSKSQQQFRAQSFQQPTKSPYEEKIYEERKSHKSNRLKSDLKNHIQELFQSSRPVNVYDKPQFSQQKGLAGFNNYKQYFRNPQVVSLKTTESEQNNVNKRVETIRYKLDDFQNQKLSQYAYKPKGLENWSPEKPIRTSIQRNKKSPQYTPGNTHRLNLEYLQKEKESQQTKVEQSQQQQEQVEDY